MALQTKTYTSAKTTRNYSIRLTLSEESTSVTDNTSSITYKLELLSEDWNFRQYACGYSVTVNGVVVASLSRASSPQISISKNDSYTICTGTTTVVHDSDGTKTITASNISASIDMPLSEAGPGAISLTAGSDWTLTTIARKSTMTIGSVSLGTGSKMFTVSAASSNFKHTITYTCGNDSGTICTKQTASTINATNYTFPLNPLASHNTTGTTVSVSVKLETFTSDGSTSLGYNTYTKSMTIPNNSSTKPSIASISITEPSNHTTTYGGYVQSVSKAKVTYTPSGKYGAGIASSFVKIGSLYTYSGSAISIDSGVYSVTSGKLTSNGSITITISVTDTRGFTTTNTSNSITVQPYSAPTISKVSFIRANQSGSALETGEYGKITFSASGTSLTGNTMTYTYYLRQGTTGSWSAGASLGYANNYNVSNGTKTGISCSSASSWGVYITAKDKFYTATSNVVTISSAEAYFYANPENKALSFGKIENKYNTLCVAWKSEFDDNVTLNNNSVMYNLKLPADQWYASVGNWGLDANNSDIIKVNGLFFADPANEPYSEGIHFYRSSTKNDTLYGYNGGLYWMPNHDKAADGTSYSVLTENNTKRRVTSATNGTNYSVSRWSDGIEEFWCTDVINVTGWNSFGSIYEGNVYRQFSFGSYPFKKYTYPMITASAYASFGLCGCELYLANSSRWQYSPRIYPLRPSNDYTGAVYVNLHAVGVYTSSENLIPPVKSGSYSGVTTTLHLFSGRTQTSGTATATGGHGTLMSDTVTLAAGTYNVEVVTTGTNSCKDAWIRSPNANHAQLTIGAGGTYTAEFTLSAETTGVYASIRVESGVTYSGTVCFSLFKTA